MVLRFPDIISLRGCKKVCQGFSIFCDSNGGDKR